MARDAAARIEGYVEALSSRKLSGWVWEIGNNRALTVEVLLDGRQIGQTQADRFRKDLLDNAKGNGKHAFEYAYPVPVGNHAAPGAVRVRVAGSDRDLPRTDTLLRRLEQEADLMAAESLVGVLASPGRVLELACCDGRLKGRAVLPGGHAGLRIAIDDVAVGEAPLQLVFDAQGRGAGPHPFELALPQALCDGAAHRIMVFDAATGRRLEGGPASVVLTAASIATAASGLASAMIISTDGDRAAWLHRVCATDQSLIVLHAGNEPTGGAVAARHLAAARLTALLSHAGDLTVDVRCTAVIVSPPSLAGLVLGNAIRQVRHCPLLVDIDDAPTATRPPDMTRLEELVRLNDEGAIQLDDPAWAPLLPALIEEADGVLAGSGGVQRAAGGMLVRRGCEEELFDPAVHDRAKLRQAAGLAVDDRLVLLAGAGEDGAAVAAAVDRLGPPLVVGVAGGVGAWPGVAACSALRDLGGTMADGAGRAQALAMADCVVVAADDGVPALPMVLEALAMGTPVLARSSVGLTELIDCGAVAVVAEASVLEEMLRQVAAGAAGGGRNRVGRMVYAGEFSRAVNALRLQMAFDMAADHAPQRPMQWQALLAMVLARGPGGPAKA